MRFENITLFVAITHYYLFNQSLSDFAQVDVANHLKSWNEHSMSYDGVPQDWFKPWNPWGTVYRCAFCAVFSGALCPPPRPRNSDKCRKGVRVKTQRFVPLSQGRTAPS